MDGSLFHSSTSNESTDSYRVAFNMRYLPTGVKCGRPFLPGFVARSRENHASELRDPVLWQNYWQAALDFYARYTPPQPNCFRLNVKQIERLEKKWEKLLPTRDSWLDLHHHGSRYRAVKSKTLWAIDHLRSRAPAIFKR